jgi:hypothetical protein
MAIFASSPQKRTMARTSKRSFPMNPRFPASMLACAAIAIVSLAFPAAGQAPSAAVTAKPAAAATTPKGWTVPRTPDGKPDLQGVFSSATTIPLERPKNLGAKEFYTPEEAAANAARAAQRAAAPAAPESGQLAVHYDVSQFGLDRSHATIVQSLRTSLIVGPEGRIPALLPDAQKRAAERQAFTRQHQWDGPETRPLGERCIMWPNEGPPMLPAGYNSDVEIVQSPGYVAVMQEMIHDVRAIPTDGSPHLPSNVRQWFGDSRGHWEGDTLVVDTTNFTDKTAFHSASENLHVVERFTRTGPDTILYQFTVDDPTTWASSWSGEYEMTRIDSPIYEYACQEGNYGMANNLSGARAEEAKKAAAEKGSK